MFRYLKKKNQGALQARVLSLLLKMIKKKQQGQAALMIPLRCTCIRHSHTGRHAQLSPLLPCPLQLHLVGVGAL